MTHEFNEAILEIANTDEQTFRRAIAAEAKERERARREEFILHFRDQVLNAMDNTCGDYGIAECSDRDLPELFRTLDTLAIKLFNSRPSNLQETPQ